MYPWIENAPDRGTGRVAGGLEANSTSVEFVDTNVLVYAHDGALGPSTIDPLSIQVLAEFYVIATKKLGMTSQEAEEVLADLGGTARNLSAHDTRGRTVIFDKYHVPGGPNVTCTSCSTCCRKPVSWTYVMYWVCPLPCANSGCASVA